MFQARMREVVSPFYLQVMGVNALRHGSGVRDALVEMGETVTPDEVCSLLRSAWREQVMGAWYSLLLPDESDTVLDAVLAAMEKSNGSLTAPVLATASVSLGWRRALPALRHYTECDVEANWGSAGFTAAALEFLEDQNTTWTVTDSDRSNLREMLAFGHTLRST